MATTYQQIGPDINGEAAGDEFGESVSMSADGTIFVVGGAENTGVNGDESGHVRVYKFDSTINSYAQFGLDIDGEAIGDQFGTSVSMSGDGTTFVVGAPFNNGINGTISGHVRVYKFNSTTDTYVQFGLDIDGEAEFDRFGTSVSISADGTTFVVSASDHDGINGTLSGHVRVYKLNSTFNRYVQVGFDIDGEAAFDFFGTSVSMSADGATFVVGAISNNGINGANSGHVRVYKFNATLNTFTQVGMDIDGEAAGDQFGTSVSISADGTTFVVGAPINIGDNSTENGHVRVYKFNSTINTFTQVGLDIDGEAAFDLFGSSVSISADGTTFVVGAISNDGVNGTNSGHARVYKFNSTLNTYTQVGLDIDGEVANDEFGFSVSMSADGTTFVAGATRNDGNGRNSGSVRVYSTSIVRPTLAPTKQPSEVPTKAPTNSPTKSPTKTPSKQPTKAPTKSPSKQPINVSTKSPTKQPTKVSTTSPTTQPTKVPTYTPPESCGIFGWNLFCPRRGKCGFWKRLLNLGNCY